MIWVADDKEGGGVHHVAVLQTPTTPIHTHTHPPCPMLALTHSSLNLPFLISRLHPASQSRTFVLFHPLASRQLTGYAPTLALSHQQYATKAQAPRR